MHLSFLFGFQVGEAKNADIDASRMKRWRDLCEMTFNGDLATYSEYLQEKDRAEV